MTPYSGLFLNCSVATELLVFFFTTNWEVFGVEEECIQFCEHCFLEESLKPVVNPVPEV
jgi:hypothetical protein